MTPRPRNPHVASFLAFGARLAGGGVLLPLALISAPSVAAPLPVTCGGMGLVFESNRGQWPAEFDYAARGTGYRMLFNRTAIDLALLGAHAAPGDEVRMRIVGAAADASATPEQPRRGRVNYVLGRDAGRWIADIPTFGAIRYANVYSGIDVVYYGNQRQLEYDFHVAAGADAAQIRLRFEGSRDVRRESDGHLAVELAHGTVRWHAPVAYQMRGDIREPVAADFAVGDDGEVSFTLGAYEHDRPLIIDPVLAYSTYYGGGGRDVGNAIAIDAEGSMYVTGSTASGNLRVSPPVTVPGTPGTVVTFNSHFAGGAADAFVLKLNASGEFVYATYIGGSGDDRGWGIAVDAKRRACVVGETNSPDFPFTSTIPPRGFGDGFYVRLTEQGFPIADASGEALTTNLGGSGFDQPQAIALDPSGNVWIAGVTFSLDLRLSLAQQTNMGDRGLFGDAFAAKLLPTGGLLVQTYIGGNDVDVGIASEFGLRECGIAVDAAGNAYIAGTTYSTNFPTTPGAFQTTKRGSTSTGDGFITKLSPNGARIYSTCLGGSSFDTIKGIAVDATGAVYVVGTSSSPDFPVTAGSFGAAPSGGGSFVAKLNPAGTALVYSGFYRDSAVLQAIAVNGAGEAIVAGGDGEVKVARINAAGSGLVYSTSFGGDGNDSAWALAIDSASTVYLTGTTRSDNFPRVGAAIQTARGGDSDVFIAKLIDSNTRLINLSTRARIPAGGDLTPGFVIGGTGTKTLLVRAIGPGLAQFGVAGPIPDPQFELIPLGASAAITGNNDWGGGVSLAAAFTAAGAFPLQASSRDAAAVVTLAPGGYTVRTSGVAGATGECVVEIYDTEATNSTARLINLSTRATLTTPGEKLVPGFVVTGNAPKQMLIRAIGPGLAPFGVTGALSDPQLAVIPLGTSTVIASNNDWGGTAALTAAATATGAFAIPANSRDAALLLTLSPGGYTVEVSGVGNATGAVLVEVYEVP